MPEHRGNPTASGKISYIYYYPTYSPSIRLFLSSFLILLSDSSSYYSSVEGAEGSEYT